METPLVGCDTAAHRLQEGEATSTSSKTVSVGVSALIQSPGTGRTLQGYPESRVLTTPLPWLPGDKESPATLISKSQALQIELRQLLLVDLSGQSWLPPSSPEPGSTSWVHPLHFPLPAT